MRRFEAGDRQIAEAGVTVTFQEPDNVPAVGCSPMPSPPLHKFLGHGPERRCGRLSSQETAGGPDKARVLPAPHHVAPFHPSQTSFGQSEAASLSTRFGFLGRLACRCLAPFAGCK